MCLFLLRQLAQIGQPRTISGHLRLENAQGGELSVGGFNQAEIAFAEASSSEDGETECISFSARRLRSLKGKKHAKR